MSLTTFAAGCLLLAVSMAVPAAALIPSDTDYARSLDGSWRFKLEQGAPPPGTTGITLEPRRLGQVDPILTPVHFEPFYQTDYEEGADWHDLAVPGNWEIAGYSPATYDHPDNASGFYREWFEVPAHWAGRLVKVNFDGVQNGAEIWLNGHPVNVSEPSWSRPNYHESGWTAFQADLTPFVKFGQKNLLAIRVTKNTKSCDLDGGDYFFLGGIHRTVTLFSVPKTHIADLTVTTHLLPGGKAEVRTAVAVGGGTSAVTVRLGDEPAQTAKPNASGVAEIRQTVAHPRLWSAEHPNLYPLTVELKDARGAVTETVKRRVGIREVSIKNGVLLVNGVPVKLTGMCRHEVYLPVGTALGPEVWRKDLAMMKEANVNAVRTSHYPYGSGFYDLCDEMGFYVMDELPYCWTQTDDASLAPAFEQRARETIARDKNHASVIVWAIGNENRPGRNLRTVADLVKKLDTTRPRLVSWLPGDMYDVEMDDLHYTTPAAVKKRAEDPARNTRWPQIYLENPNDWDVRNGADYGCLDQWVEVLKRSWDVAWNEPNVPGEFMWEWQDRAIIDNCPVKHYAYDPVTHIQYVKTKGIVDGWRHPRPQYYNVKMVYSPIVVDPTVDLTSRPGTAILKVTNRYSFTDLKELRANWRLLRDGRPLKFETAHLALAPRSSGTVALALPKDVLADADTLRIDFDHPGGWNVVTAEFRLKPEPPLEALKPIAVPPAGPNFPRFNLIVRETKGDPFKWDTAYRYPAHLINVKTEPAVDGDYTMQPMAQLRAIDGDIVLDNAPQTVVGHAHAEYVGDTFRYRVDWTGPRWDVQEIGWTFEMPEQNDRFSWKKQALWSYYPDTHIGRPEGTARPDTANVRNTNVDRPNAFDWNSTKYDCDWASLTGVRGHGLRVEFAPDQRHQVRAGFGEGTDYTLVVNRWVCPPRDLSSNIVPDLYHELNRGDHLEGSFRVGLQ